jgi:hypothetical protein
MAITHPAQDRYSALVLAKLRASLVLQDGIVFNNDYEGNPVAGKVRIPVRDTEVLVGDYDVATGLAIGQGATSYLDVLINKQKAVNELIDGYEAAAVPDGLIAERLDSAGYALARQLDSDGATELLASGTVTNVDLITAADAYSHFVDIRTLLSKANVPPIGRYALVTPDFLGLLLKSPEFIKASDLGDAVVQTGAIGKIAGFSVFEFNDNTPNLRCICGHPGWSTRVKEWSVPVAINNLGNQYIGASAVQGRLVYGHKLTKPLTVRIIYSPGELDASLTAVGAALGKTKIVCTAPTGTAKYRKNPATRVVFDQSDSGFTAITTDPTVVVGDILEVVDFVGGLAKSVCYLTVTADVIGTGA